MPKLAPRAVRLIPILLVLLVAFGLRAYQLTELPPGLTHDEANHGREAISILQGELALFFPLNYGSEPLYSYTVAGTMQLVGRQMLSLRLVNVYFSLLAVAATFAWASRAFDRKVALLAAGMMGVSFWSVASGREALRAGMMPFFMAGAVIFFWQLLRKDGGRRTEDGKSGFRLPPLVVLCFALCLTATFYNYLASRVTWLLFPAFLVYLAVVQRARFKQMVWPTVGGLVLAGLLVVPMFVYLENNPDAQTRLSMLDGTIQNTLEGHIGPVLENAGEALLAFVLPGRGDQFLAYNIPGRAVFDPLTALFFIIGTSVCLWNWRKPAYAFVLLWFIIGIAPSLVTGPTANTTRNVGAMPAVFILPAIGAWAVGRWPLAAGRWSLRTTHYALLTIYCLLVGSLTANAYFIKWGQSPDVRAAYQQTLVAGLARLDEQSSVETAVVSSVYPGIAHNPSISLVLADPERTQRWVDGRYGMVWPAGAQTRVLAMAATPLHPVFAGLGQEVERVDLRPDDLNPSFTIYTVAPPVPSANFEPLVFGAGEAALTLLEAEWLAVYRPGEVAELMMVWRVDDPAGVGPVVPPLATTDVVLFTHVLDEMGNILFQRDTLDAPSWDWQAGDVVVQIHQIFIPEGTPAGLYETAVGVYDRLSWIRLPLLKASNPTDDSRAFVVPLEIERLGE